MKYDIYKYLSSAIKYSFDSLDSSKECILNLVDCDNYVIVSRNLFGVECWSYNTVLEKWIYTFEEY